MKCPNCGYNLSKTNRKTAVKKEIQRKFVLANMKLFDEQNWIEVIKKARKEIGYSDKTVNTDILSGLRIVYHIIKGDILK